MAFFHPKLPNFTDNFIVQNISDFVKERAGGEGTSSLKMK
jgi:hypothetical protein